MAFVRVSGAEIYYEVLGDGPQLVLVPGFASGAWTWGHQVPELANTFRVITFDPRGVARSTVADGASTSIAFIADDIAAILDSLGVDAAHVLGISFGGFVAQEFAMRHASRLNKLVLASTSFGGPDHVPPSPEVLASFASTEGMNTADRIRRHLTQAFSQGFVAAYPEVVARFCSLRESNPVPEEVYRQQLQSAVEFNADPRVSEIGAETLIVTGDNDTVVPVQNSRNLAARLPNARLEIIKNSGHMAFVERADEFNRIVREFLI